MLYAIVTYLTAWGLGQLLGRIVGVSWPGLRFYLGLCLIPLLLLILDLPLGLPLSAAADVVGLVAAVGLVRWARDTSRGEVTGLAIHPVFVLPVMHALVSAVSPVAYEPSRYDEFTYWLLMPKQMILVNHATPHGLPFPSRADYAPGWSLLVAYPFLATHQRFTPGPLLWLPFLCATGVAATIFDLIGSTMRRSSIGATTASWVGALLAPAFGLVSLVPEHLLVEPPLEGAWILLFLLLALGTTTDVEPRTLGLSAGLLLAAGWLLKKPFAAALPIGGILWWGLRRESSHRHRIADAVAILGPVLLVMTIWTVATYRIKPSIPVFGWNPKAAPAALLAAAEEQLGLLFRASPILALATAVGGVGLIFTKRYRITCFGWLAYATVYCAGLAWLYCSGAFPDQTVLPGFSRYIGSLGAVTACLVFVLSYTAVLGSADHATRLSRPALPIALIALASAVSGQVFLQATTEPAHLPAYAEGEQLVAILRQREVPPYQHATLIAQNDRTGILLPLARFVALHDDRRPAFTSVGTRFILEDAPEEENRYTLRVSRDQFARLIEASAIVWPMQLSPWMNSVLRTMTDPERCHGPLEDYFLISASGRDDRRIFDCVKKSAGRTPN